MATQETQLVDDLMVKSRRKMLSIGGAALAGMMFGARITEKEVQAASYTDADILNFALNLEYLEANFYYQAAFGTTIDVANSYSTAAGGPSAGIPITVTGSTTSGAGVVANVSGATQVPFSTGVTAAQAIAIGAYATETAIEEGKHVLALQAALGSYAVSQPMLNLSTTWWAALGSAATNAAVTNFNPYANAPLFLLGAYVFEDVGVTAYHGAASLLTGTTTTLPVAAGILAVEAYHAGLVRTTLNNLDPTNSSGYLGLTNQISALRAMLSGFVQPGVNSTDDPSPDDFGLLDLSVTSGTTDTPVLVSLAGASPVPATRIVDVDLNANDAYNCVAIARNTNQVLNIVTGGGKAATAGATLVTPAIGGFFPAGMNAGTTGFK